MGEKIDNLIMEEFHHEGTKVHEGRKEEMEERDAIAAAARLALLGTSAELAVPFEELKEEIRDRWRGVVEVVQGAFVAETERTAGTALPSRDDMAKWIYCFWGTTCGIPRDWDEWNGKAFFYAVADPLLEKLAPYLREPTGWELDVTAKELYDIIKNSKDDTRQYGDYLCGLELIRSRIRPTFECQECAARNEAMMKPQPEVRCAGCVKWEAYGVKMEDNARVLAKRIDAVRTALESE